MQHHTRCMPTNMWNINNRISTTMCVYIAIGHAPNANQMQCITRTSELADDCYIEPRPSHPHTQLMTITSCAFPAIPNTKYAI